MVDLGMRTGLRSTIAAMTGLIVLACGGEEPVVSPEAIGALEVTVSTTGDQPDGNGYTLAIWRTGGEKKVESDGAVLFEGLTAGDRVLEMGDLQANCAPEGENPRAVKVVADDTARLHLEIACSPAFLDGITFVSDRDGNRDIYAMAADGSAPTNLTNHPGDDFGATISPDGTRIAFLSDRGGAREAYVMGFDGSDPMVLTDDDLAPFPPVWSPDGTRLAVVNRRTNDNVQVISADGSERSEITSEARQDWGPDWSPDGSKIVFTSEKTTVDREIRIVAADGSQLTTLVEASFAEGTNWMPAWAPMGEQIAFTSTRTGHWEIHTINEDGSDFARLTHDRRTDYRPAWSPDGAEIAYMKADNDGTPDVHVMAADGEDSRRLTYDAASDDFPSWSPDGSRIAFVSERDGNREIYVVDAGGGSLANLTNHPAEEFYHDWAPMSHR